VTALVRKRHDRAAARRAADIGRRVEYVTFALAGEAYAVPISRVAEILKPLPITPVPRAPRIVIGVITDTGDERIGLLVDEVMQVHRLAESEIEPRDVLGGDPEPYLAGIGRPEGAILILLDLRPILET